MEVDPQNAPIKILSIIAWWSEEQRSWIASAQPAPGIVATGQSFLEAVKNLDAAVDAHKAQELFEK
jgi:predicted RNase H-like HicB family nuclease